MEFGDDIDIGCGMWYRVLMLGVHISAEKPQLFPGESIAQKALTDHVPFAEGFTM